MDLYSDYKNARLMSAILTFYYLDNLNQYQIAERLGLSTTKVNRLLKQARQSGMVEIVIKTPFQTLFELEQRFERATGIKKAIIVPNLTDNYEATLQLVGQVAANYLLEQLQDGDTICLGGGRTLHSLVMNLPPIDSFKGLTVVPALGGVQGRYETDVNHLAAELSNRLGGISYALHAPAITDSPAERDHLLHLRQVAEVLDKARRARIGIIGIGSLRPETASYFRFAALNQGEIDEIVRSESNAGEILAHIIDPEGCASSPIYEDRVVGLRLDELDNIPLTVSVAALPEKAAPIAAAIRGGHIKVLVTDELAAVKVLEMFEN